MNKIVLIVCGAALSVVAVREGHPGAGIILAGLVICLAIDVITNS